MYYHITLVTPTFPGSKTNLKILISIPNFLSFSRVPLALIIFWAIVNGLWEAAFLLFFFACLTDIADGYLARQKNQVTPFGGLLDHTSDAIIATLTLAALSDHGWVPVYLVYLVPIAFIQYSIDSKVFLGSKLRPSSLGRINGIAYQAFCGFILIQLASDTFILEKKIVYISGCFLSGTTILSMIQRIFLVLSRK
mgnify:CR=1 FL=1